jgi:hypothetical protein
VVPVSTDFFEIGKALAKGVKAVFGKRGLLFNEEFAYAR